MVKRFSVLHRFLHILVMLGFIGLGLTGFSLKFSSQAWAQAVAWVFGGAGGMGWWHRAFAVVTYFSVLAHLVWLLYYKIALKGRLTGPHTMFPRWQDFKDLARHIGYFMGKGQAPRFERFAYWEKLDYFAVLLGMQTMGLTGVILWFPEFFTSFLPGWALNLAFVLHFYEAIIAVALKFVVHVAVAHLRPTVFPMNNNIFTGYEPLERVRHERPSQWEALNQGSKPQA
jgi:cytochrome b subunit of formate dehydrogenase